MRLAILTITLVALGPFQAGAQSTGTFDPNGLRAPGRLCSLLADRGLAAVDGWSPSRSEPGGYVCRPLGTAVAVGGGQVPTMLNAYVYGGGPQKLDRFTLKLNVFNAATADAGKRALLEAATKVAAEMRLQLPVEVARLVLAQPIRNLPSPPSERPRTLFRQQVGSMVVHLEAEQSRITALLIHFRNPAESGLW